MTVNLMSFGTPEERPFADLVMGHVPFADLIAALRERYTIEDDEDLPNPSRLRYEFATFGNDEAINFNVAPTEKGAKAVTVAYHRWIPPQDGTGVEAHG